MIDFLQEKADLLKVLATPARYRIIKLLLASEMNTGDIALACGISRMSASHELCFLHDFGYISRRASGTFMYYRCNHPGLETLQPVVAELLARRESKGRERRRHIPG